jgi:hypothetical protein
LRPRDVDGPGKRRFETRNQRDLTVGRKTSNDGIKVGAYHGRHGSEGFAVGARDGDGIGGGGGIQTTRAATAGGVEVSTVGDGDSGRLGGWGKERQVDRLVPPDRKWPPDSPIFFSPAGFFADRSAEPQWSGTRIPNRFNRKPPKIG